MNGSVYQMEVRLNVTFRLLNQPDVALEFVVDTGFAGALTLPVTTVAALKLPFLQEMTANLADDNSVKTDVHVATILWEGEERRVAVLAMGSRPLLGTALLGDQELVVQFVEDGLVTINPLE
jgi:clan AA aspartic protease